MWKRFLAAFEPFYRGHRAIAQAAETNRIERYFTFANFERSADRVADELAKAGLSQVEVESFPADGKTSWSGWGRLRAWNVESAQLWLVHPHRELLCDWIEVPQSLVMYSGTANTEAELIEWNGETGVALTGKIPLTRERLNDVFPVMRQHGVRGILSDFIGKLPGVREPLDVPDSCRWENAGIRAAAGEHWGFSLTPRQGVKLRALMRQGPVRVHAQIQASVGDGIFKSASAIISGRESPDEELLFLSHLYEPGANDNASGVGCGLEIARSLMAAIEAGAIERPRRSIRFLFGWEGHGLIAWAEKHAAQLGQMLGGINIDEIGVDQTLGRSVVHLFMPPAANPSCVGPLLAHLCGQILTPRMRWKAVADRAEIINDMITCDPNIDVPLPCLIQYPSKHYHASTDTIETLGLESMTKIGHVAATQLYSLANAGGDEAAAIAEITRAYHATRLHEIDLKSRQRRWPFSVERTTDFQREQFRLAIDSVRRFGLSDADAERFRSRLDTALESYLPSWRENGMAAATSDRSPADARRDARILKRGTLGSPTVSSFVLPPDEAARFRSMLFDHNLDLVFLRICYWADGRRSLAEIIERLAFDLEDAMSDSDISRTASGQAIDASTVRIDPVAIDEVVERLVAAGFLLD